MRRSLVRYAKLVVKKQMASNKNSVTWPKFAYPTARRDETVFNDYHGTKIFDPYRWLEDPDSVETKAFVEKLNDLSKPFLENCPSRNKIQQKLKELWDYPKYGCPRKEGEHYFYYYNTGLQNQSVLFIQDHLDGEAKVFLDPNKLSDDGTTSINSSAYSEDGKIFAYALSEKGSDWVTLKFKKIPSGEEFPDNLERLKFTSIAWTHDNKGVFYNKYPQDKCEAVGTSTNKNEFHQVYYHYLGTKQSEDVLCVEFPKNADYMIGAHVTEDGKFLICNVSKGCDPENLIFYYDLSSHKGKIESKLEIKSIIDEFESKFDFVTNDGEIFTFVTDYKAPFFKLVQIDVKNPDKKFWKTLVEEEKNHKLDWAARVNGDFLILCYIEDVKHVLHIHDLKTGRRLSTLPLDIGSVTAFSGKEKLSEIFYTFQSFLTPGITYHCKLSNDDQKPKVFRTIEVKGIDSKEFDVKQIFYESKDKTKVPMYLVHKKGLDLNGDHPTLLYGYGGFNISLMPYFSVSRSFFMRHLDGLFVVANLRGGDEYGKTWHEEGMKEKKQNVFDDFIGAAEYLITNKLTSKDKLAIQGGSNGGLLVAACANQRPDLFGCVINQVGVLDMLRYQNFTIGQAWVPEFGCSEKKDEFKYILNYSPLHNLVKLDGKRCQYPATLLLTADHDDRVVPLHSLKYMAELYHLVKDCEHQKKPLMIRVETKAGHGGGKPTTKIIEEHVDIYCFLVNVFNLQYKE